MTASFQARVSEHGKVVWSDPRVASEFFAAIQGQRITITVEPPGRSAEMNRLLHAIFREFTTRTGYTPAQAKEYLKAQYIEDGRGTSEMNADEAASFAEFCQSWLAEKLG